jgi:hypothetical protein
LLAPRRRSWLVAASLLLALALGVTCGWLRRHSAGPAYAAAVPVVDRESRTPAEHEKNLLRAAEEYLAQPNKNTDVQTGAGNCRNLAVYYLEQHRLDDAESLFRRLNAVGIRPYHVLGHLGLGVVAALRNKPHESNKFFRDIFFAGKADLVVKRLDGLILGHNPQWSYWLARAVDYNRKNHLDDKEIPPPLLRLVGAHP